MIKGSKICGISDLNTLNFIINHPYPPQFIGFICNYKKSSRYVEIEKLNELLAIDKNKSDFVAVLVKPDEDILEKIKHLPFDYYQIYDCTPDEIKSINSKAPWHVDIGCKGWISENPSSLAIFSLSLGLCFIVHEPRGYKPASIE